jgi:hypothetical protein
MVTVTIDRIRGRVQYDHDDGRIEYFAAMSVASLIQVDSNLSIYVNGRCVILRPATLFPEPIMFQCNDLVWKFKYTGVKHSGLIEYFPIEENVQNGMF